MGNSSIQLQQVLDWTKAKGIPIPTDLPAGYGTDLAIKIGNDVMGDIIAERFNWKWNRGTAPFFYTNSWQQDYPQIGNVFIGWLEDADRVDINNTSMPKPIKNLTVRRQLSRTSHSWRPIEEICWMYNFQLSFGTWPGPGVTLYPPLGSPTKQNPILSMIDANGNYLIVTGYGITGLTPPLAPKDAPEGTQISDGGPSGYGQDNGVPSGYGETNGILSGYGVSPNGVIWTVVDPLSQGFRVFPLPGASGPVYQVIPYYQIKALPLVNLQSFLNPIPDDYQRIFQTGYETYCLQSSPNPGDRARFADSHAAWLKGMDTIRKQGDREADAYGMLPATSPVESIYPGLRNPQDPGQPY